MHVMTIALPAHCSRIGMSKGRQLEGESEKGQGKLHEFALGEHCERTLNTQGAIFFHQTNDQCSQPACQNSAAKCGLSVALRVRDRLAPASVHISSTPQAGNCDVPTHSISCVDTSLASTM